jgi:acyl carrier protein
MDTAAYVPEFFGLQTTFFSIPLHFTPYDMMFNVVEVSDGLILDCDYNTDLFEASAIEQFMRYYETLLNQIALNPDLPLNALSLLTKAEKAELIEKYANVSSDALPLTTNGKINRSALPDITGDTKTYTAPQTDTQKTLASVWASVVGLKSVGIHDDFFDIGGHSLLLMRVQSRIRDIFQVELPLNQLFEIRTIAELAQVLVTYESVPGQIEKIANLRQKIEAMSEEEVKAMLKEKKGG